ncbi:MAG TPA: hypothetical protein VI078_09670 [bacterium]
MLPRLGGTYELNVERRSQPKAEYHTDAYYALDLPVAPAIMVEDEIVIEGKDVSDEELEAAIRRHLGLPALPVVERKGLLGRILGT